MAAVSKYRNKTRVQILIEIAEEAGLPGIDRTVLLNVCMALSSAAMVLNALEISNEVSPDENPFLNLLGQLSRLREPAQREEIACGALDAIIAEFALVKKGETAQ